eukprot:s41_g5.t2
MSPLKGGFGTSLPDVDPDAIQRLQTVSLWYKKDARIAEQQAALAIETASSSVAKLHSVLEVLVKALAAGAEEGGGKVIVIGDEGFDDRAMLKEKCQSILKLYKNGDHLQPQDANFMFQLLAHHPRGEEKAQGCQSFAVGNHPTHPTRCFFVVRANDSEDFSFIRCVDRIPTFEVICQERISEAICRILKVHPVAMSSFASRIEESFPPIRGARSTVERHRNWASAILFLCTRMQALTECLLILLIRRMVQIDSDINKLEQKLPPEDEVFGDGGEQATKQEIDYKAQILDCNMTLCFEFMQKHLSIAKVQDYNKSKLVVTLMHIFDGAVLHTHKVRCVQFLWFYLSNLDVTYAEAFLAVLLQVAYNPREMLERRILALWYVASFIVRSKDLTAQYALASTQHLSRLARELFQAAEAGQPTEFQVNFLLAVLQAVCYVLCWKVEVFNTTPVEQSAVTGLEALLPDPAQGHKVGPDAFTPLLLSEHQPITQIRRFIAKEFCRQIRPFREKVAAQLDSQLKKAQSTKIRVPSTMADELGCPAAAFFPFEPYRLRHSSLFVRDIFKLWHDDKDDRKWDTDDDEDGATDEEGFGHDLEGKVRTMSGSSEKDEASSDMDFTDQVDAERRGFIASAAPSPAFRPSQMDALGTVCNGRRVGQALMSCSSCLPCGALARLCRRLCGRDGPGTGGPPPGEPSPALEDGGPADPQLSSTQDGAGIFDGISHGRAQVQPEHPCRICLEETGELYSPCVCRGSAKYVHLDCIEAAFRARGMLLDLSCPTCKHHYEGAAAVRLGTVALAELRSRYGEEHPVVGAALHNFGVAYGLCGNAVAERDHLEKALEIQEREFGPDHCDVATTLSNLGNAYDRLGNINKQKELLERALAINEREYGPNHHVVATTLVNLGSVYGRLGEHETQRDILERALQIMEAEFGLNSHKVSASLVNLSLAYGALGDVKRQRDLLERALKINEQEYGRDHRAVANTLLNLGNVYGCLGDVKAKRDLLERALKIKQREFGAEHAEVAKALVSLGNAYGDLGNVDHQKELLEKALSIQERHFGSDHWELLSSLTGLSMVYDRMRDFHRKKELLEKSVSIMERSFGSTHYNVGVILAALAQTCGDLGEFQRKKDLLERSVQIMEIKFGQQHRNVAVYLVEIAHTCEKLGDTEGRDRLLRRASEIEEAERRQNAPKPTLKERVQNLWVKGRGLILGCPARSCPTRAAASR